MPLRLLRCLRAKASVLCSLGVPHHCPCTPDASTFSAFFPVDGPAVSFIDGHPLCQVDGARHSARLGCQARPVITLPMCCARLFLPLMHRLEWGQVWAATPRARLHAAVLCICRGAGVGTVTSPPGFLSLFAALSNGAWLRPGSLCLGCCVLNFPPRVLPLKTPASR